jgi:hypothetical protein
LERSKVVFELVQKVLKERHILPVIKPKSSIQKGGTERVKPKPP